MNSLPSKRPWWDYGAIQGLVELGNINLAKRPHVKNPDGSVSTIRSISVTDDQGRVILIPTVVGKKVVSNEEAWKHYLKTGEHLGMFSDLATANHFAQLLHEDQVRLGVKGGIF